MTNKPVLDTPLPPNVKAEPTHKPWRRLRPVGKLIELRHWQQIEDEWLVTYWDVYLPFSVVNRDLNDCVATWEPVNK